MNKREAGLVARAVAIIDAGGNFEEAARILRPLAGPKTLGPSFKPITRTTPIAFRGGIVPEAFKGGIVRKQRPKAKRSKPRRGRVIDKPYKAFIASLPCLICCLSSWRYWLKYRMSPASQSQPNAEVAHVGIRGLGQKCSDRETVPLCKQHHTEGKESERALGKRFWSFHGLDKAEVIKALNAEYERRAA